MVYAVTMSRHKDAKKYVFAECSTVREAKKSLAYISNSYIKYIYNSKWELISAYSPVFKVWNNR